jgi:multidrug efflux pump subunit AcrB
VLATVLVPDPEPARRGYEVVLLQQTREDLATTGNPLQAIRAGLRETAAPATGTAAVMLAAVVPFATTDLITVRQFGVGVALAV